MSKPTLIEQDIINVTHDLVYIITLRHQPEIIGMYQNLSHALKELYISDEVTKLLVSRLNYTGRRNLLSNFDSLVGSFQIGDNDELFYTRALTQEKQQIQPDKYISETDFNDIVTELDQYQKNQALTDLNPYHIKTIKLVDDVIKTRFETLAKLYLNDYLRLVSQLNTEFQIDLDYELLVASHKFYHQTQMTRVSMKLEQRIDVITQINLQITKCQNDIASFKQLIKDFTESPSDTEPEINLETDLDGYDYSQFWSSNIMNPFDQPNEKIPIDLSQPPIQSTHKFLYDETSPKAPYFPPKERNPDRPKKIVNFNLEQTITHILPSPSQSPSPLEI